MARRPLLGGGVRVPAKEVRELVKLAVRDEELSDRRWDIRRLPDGRVLWYLNDTTPGIMYPSGEVFAQLKRELEAEAAKDPFDPAKELLPPLDDFLRDVEAHARGLGKVLRIPDEVLDRSTESIDLVDKAVARMRTAKRMTPEVFTPLVAYVGEVMRLVCDGRWGKLPATKKKQRAVFDSTEYAAWLVAQSTARQAANEAGAKAETEARAKGASEYRATLARDAASRDALDAAMAGVPAPTVLRYDEYDVRLDGAEHEPVIWAHDRGLVQPMPAIVKTLVERSTYGPLRNAVEGRLARYFIAKRTAAKASQ
jgi:hypothetical protein